MNNKGSSKNIITRLKQLEHRSMSDGLVPIVISKAKGYTLYDPEGKKYIDWTSGAATVNTGYGNTEIKDAIIDVLNDGVYSCFTFAHPRRLALEELLIDFINDQTTYKDYKVQLLSGGSEAVECAIALARSNGISIDKNKKQILSFRNSFHGNTLGSFLNTGFEKNRDKLAWGNYDFNYATYPNKHTNQEVGFDYFLKELRDQNLKPENLAGIIIEPYQGKGVYFIDKEFAKQLRKFCEDNKIVLIYDEIQSGFGRTGKPFAFQYTETEPDILILGKGLSSSLPISAVVGKKDIFDNPDSPDTLTTQSGNPIATAAAIANIRYIKDNNLWENARKMGEILLKELKSIDSDLIEYIEGKGLSIGVHFRGNNNLESAQVAEMVVNETFKRGLLLFPPNGRFLSCIRITPPLIIDEQGIQDGLKILKDILINIQ